MTHVPRPSTRLVERPFEQVGDIEVDLRALCAHRHRVVEAGEVALTTGHARQRQSSPHRAKPGKPHLPKLSRGPATIVLCIIGYWVWGGGWGFGVGGWGFRVYGLGFGFRVLV